MANKKLKIGVLYGGKSAEHDVSLMSAKNVIAALDKNKYEIKEIKIPRNGIFDFSILKKVDVVFPVLHGPFGEDGSIQGLLKLMNVPFVGAGVLGSAVGMDKDVMKRLLRDSGVNIARFVTIKSNEKVNFADLKQELGLPMFVKPANMGSSIGVNKVNSEIEFKKAVKTAFEYDNKIIIEENIVGREIECSVMGNGEPVASVPGEVVSGQKFYSYDAKYFDSKSRTIIPAEVDRVLDKKIREVAILAYKALCAEGMARVDFFVTKGNKVLVNEINTIPGFTNISMYPKLWEASGIPPSKLVDILIHLALERYKREKMLKTSKS